MSLAWGLNRWCESVLMSRERFGGILLSGLFYGGITLGAVILRYQIVGISATQVVQIQSFAAALTVLVLFATHPELRQLGRPTRQWAARLFHFGKFTFGTNLLSMLLNKADMMLIGALLPAQAVVLYDIAGRLFGYFDVPLNSLAQVYLPRLSKLGRQPEALARAYETAVSSLLKVVIPVAVIGIVLAPQLVTWLGGNGRTEAADLLRVMALATLIKPWGRIGGIALDATDRPQANTILLIFSAAISLGLQYVLISSMGLSGAAIAVAATIWLTVWPGQWWISRQIPFSHRRILAGIFKF
jgi:O-antigen/teichoic acid export membrane protein